MRVLVAVASRHGSTAEIAERIGRVLRARGSSVDVVAVRDVRTIDGYDAVVLGSAVYMGRWISSARRFARTWSRTLEGLPVWLFFSGPLGAAPELEGRQLPDVERISQTIGSLDHGVFAGRLDRGKLSVVEKALAGMTRAPDGDYRNWPAIEAWADGIADTCAAAPAPPVPPAMPVD